MEKVRNQLNVMRESIDNTIRWHTTHLERIEQQMDTDYDPDLEHNKGQERLVREAGLINTFLDDLTGIIDHVDEMSRILDEMETNE